MNCDRKEKYSSKQHAEHVIRTSREFMKGKEAYWCDKHKAYHIGKNSLIPIKCLICSKKHPLGYCDIVRKDLARRAG